MNDSAPLPPGPRYSNPLQFARELRPDPLDYYRRLVKEYGEFGCVHMWPRKIIWTLRPEHYRFFMVENAEDYPKGNAFDRLKAIGGEGLFFSDGELWKKQRRLIMPSFRRSAIKKYVPHMTAGAAAFAERIEAHIGEPAFDIVPEMATVAMDIACRAFFGDDIIERANILHDALWDTSEWIDNVMNNPLAPPMWVPTAINRKTKRAIATMYAGIDELIRDNRKRGDTNNVLARLNGLVADGEMSEQQLRDEMWTLLNAGHETTATTLGFAFSLLSQHPEALERVQKEADSLGGRVPTFDDRAQLGFTSRVVLETLRLYPPAWSTSREAMKDNVVDGFLIPKKSLLQPLFYQTLMHPDIWDDPQTFDPDRFLSERSEGRAHEAYPPFGLGGRRCIGEQFALVEATMVLATFAQRFEFRLEPGFEVVAGIMGFGPIRAKSGIRMTVHHRAREV
jgi:cytochrome P450